MDKQLLKHRLTIQAEPFTGDNVRFVDGTMFDGLSLGQELAGSSGHDVSHEVYNEHLDRWIDMGCHHSDGTYTREEGLTVRWTGDRRRYWEKIEKESESPEGGGI